MNTRFDKLYRPLKMWLLIVDLVEKIGQMDGYNRLYGF